VSEDFGALVLALVGVLGTLSASIVTQILSARNQSRAFGLQIRREREQEMQAIKRACYVAMFANSRRYRVELMNYLYAIRAKAVNDGARAALEEARRAYSTSVAETELTADAEVLTAIKQVDKVLAGSFARIKALEREGPQSNSSFEEVMSTLGTFWDLWPSLQDALRRELQPTKDATLSERASRGDLDASKEVQETDSEVPETGS
jgi:hypothetical protein